MKTLLDVENWPVAHFHFFRQFEEPLFCTTVEIDCTKAYETTKALNTSFFIYYLHKTLVAQSNPFVIGFLKTKLGL